ncbi:hypothetical protein SASPL_150704 [Salvia splendens]|uniref:Uncharacterized protein n=1 Tax=Salvia splendens TaxID=180675 RepID=A0A8X8W785_SALSN|nr:hypothetical protein SASPL_150704 [Salvia splendens]
MSSARRAGQAAGESSGAKRLRKWKSVDDGESSGKRTRLAGKPSTTVVGVPVQVKRPQLRIKRTAHFFQRILKSLNERQKTAVRQLGFGSSGNISVVVDTKDVELIFSFPNGGITIDRCDRNTCIKFLETVPLDEEADMNAMQTKLDENEMGGAEMTTGVQPLATEDVVEPPATEDGELLSIEDVVEERYSSDEVVKKDSFRITCDTLRRAFRLDEKDFDPVESMTQSQTANYRAAEDWSESLKSLLDAADEMEILENKDDYPSFSLGFDSSQDHDACQPEAEPQPETDNTTHDEEGDASKYKLREPTDLFLKLAGIEPVANAQVGTVVNEENAIDVASAIARDVVSEVHVAVCSAVEAVLELEMTREQSTYAEIQPAPARRLRLPTGRREGAASTRISSTWTREEMDCYQFLLATPYMDHVIYADDVVEVTKKKFSSLKPHEAVDAEVIDVWASYLNGMETYNVVERRASWEKSEAELTFYDEIDGQFNGAGPFDITHYDLALLFGVLFIEDWGCRCASQVVPENGIPDQAKYGRDLDLLLSILCELD